MQSLKKPVAKVTEAGTAGSLPWGRGFAPQQLSVGAVPAGTRAFACSGRKQPPGEHIPLCSTPSTAPPPQVSTGYFPWGQAASQLKKCSNNKQKKCSVLPPTSIGMHACSDHSTGSKLTGQEARSYLRLGNCGAQGRCRSRQPFHPTPTPASGHRVSSIFLFVCLFQGP